MRTENFYNSTLNAITNLVNNNFKAVFDTHSSIEIELDLEDDIREFIKYAAENKLLIGVILGEKALEVLKSDDFIQEDLDRQFDDNDSRLYDGSYAEEDDDDRFGMPAKCYWCDGCYCDIYRGFVDVLNESSDSYSCPKGHLLSIAEKNAQAQAEELAWENQYYSMVARAARS